MSSLLSDRALLWLGAMLYLAGFIMGALTLMQRKTSGGPRVILRTLLVGGFFFQTTGLYLRGLTVGGCPLGNTFELFQFVAWSAMVLFFVVGTTFRVSLLGLFTAGYAATLAFISLLVPHWDAVRELKIFGNNPWIEFHAALAVFSYGVFGLLALTSVMLLLQTFSLKNKKLDGLFWFLPSVVELDHINHRVLLAGVGLLTLSLGIGASWWVRNTNTVDAAKLSITITIWLAYLVTCVLRWRGRLVAVRFAWVCIVLFVIALMSLKPVNASRHTTVPVPASR